MDPDTVHRTAANSPRMPIQRLLSPLKALTRLRTASTVTTPSETLEELREGLSRVLYRKGEVFYNPAQVVNRDLSILLLRHHARTSPPLKILEALSATGLRSIRYALEIPNVASIIANDLDPSAVETIRRNVEHNALSKIIEPTCADAITKMALAREKRFDVVDLDPYGSAAPFLDSAIGAIANGGILAVTCTDLAVLCGNSPEICYARYGSTPLKGPNSHEMAVRIVLSAAQAAANRHSRALEPLLCVKIDFYVRLFLRVHDSKSLAQRTASNTALVVQCNQCGSHWLQRMGGIKESVITRASRRERKRRKMGNDGAENGDKEAKPEARKHVKFNAASVGALSGERCKICEGSLQLGGPIWAGPLLGEGIADSILEDLKSGEGAFQAKDRVTALVTVLKEELELPMFMHLPSMCKTLRVSAPPAASIRQVLEKRGYRVSQSHTDPQAIKTDAPVELIWDILRQWVKKSGNSFPERKEGTMTAGERILQKESGITEEIDFTVKKDRFVRHGLVKTAARFPHNPEPNWGPKARAGKRKREVHAVEEEKGTA